MFGSFCILSYTIDIAMHWKYQLEKRKPENWFAWLSPSSSILNLGTVEDIWSVLVEDDWLPIQVASTGHRQEGQEAEHVEVAPVVWRASCARPGLVGALGCHCLPEVRPATKAAWAPACLLAWAAGAEIVSYLPALASTLSFSLAHHCPRLGAIKNRVTYQKMKKKFFYACYYTET